MVFTMKNKLNELVDEVDTLSQNYLEFRTVTKSLDKSRNAARTKLYSN